MVGAIAAAYAAFSEAVADALLVRTRAEVADASAVCGAVRGLIAQAKPSVSRPFAASQVEVSASRCSKTGRTFYASKSGETARVCLPTAKRPCSEQPALVSRVRLLRLSAGLSESLTRLRLVGYQTAVQAVWLATAWTVA